MTLLPPVAVAVSVASPTVRRHRPDRRSAFSVLVCRGCCCGTVRKHPHVEHAKHLAHLQHATNVGGGQLRIVDCLDVCQRSNVVVVRRHGHPATWIGDLHTDTAIETLSRWIESGAIHQLPTDLVPIERPQTNEAAR